MAPPFAVVHGQAWRENLDAVDRLRPIAEAAGCSVAQLAVSWTISRPGVASALCGAKRPEQIRETAAVSEITVASAERIP